MDSIRDEVLGSLRKHGLYVGTDTIYQLVRASFEIVCTVAPKVSIIGGIAAWMVKRVEPNVIKRLK